MGKKQFQARVVAGRYTLPAAVLLVVACRVAMAALLPGGGQGGGGTLWRQHVTLPPSLWLYWGGFLLHVGVGWLLIALNNAFGIIRTRASFQTVVYLLLATVLCADLYTPRAGDVVAVLFVVSLFFLFRSYRHPASSTHLFVAAACLGVGSLAVPPVLFLLPCYWIGAYTFQSLTARSFLASVVGVALPYWFLLAHACWHGQMELFTAPFLDLAAVRPPLEGLDARRLCQWGYLFVLYAAAAGRFFAKGYEDKIRTRCFLRFFILVSFCLFVYLVLQPLAGEALVPLLAVCVSILAGHLFVLSHGRAAGLFFVLALAGIAALFVLDLWMLS